jgi:osmoprotectant transport system permease protein
MEHLADTLTWFATGDHWTGPTGVPRRLVEHLRISALPLVAAALVAIPAGVLAGHYRRGQAIGAAIANIGRAIPTLALLVFGVLLSLRWLDLGLRFWPIVFALFFLALHPLFTNAYTAVREVDQALIEAARGQGLTEGELLRQVEVPLSVPVISTAVRITAVQVIATAPIGALAGGGGLGRFVIDGFQQFDYGEMLAGVIVIAGLALAVDAVLTRVERRLAPRGIRRVDAADVAAAGRAS